MEIPNIENGALIAVLGVIGTALMKIAKGLSKMLSAYIDAKKLEAIEQGKLLARLESVQKDVDELKKDLKGVAQFVGTPRSKGELNG